VKKILIDNLLARVEGNPTYIGLYKYTIAFGVGFALGTIIKLGNITYSKIAEFTTNLENPKYESNKETSKFIKIFIFRCVNA